jgi:hypothetical protein
MSGWTWALSPSPSPRGLTGPKSAAGTPTIRSPAAFAGYGDAPAPWHVPAAAPAATPELPGGFRANTPGSPTPAEASFTRSQASWSRTTPGWQSRTLPSTTCSAMAPLPAPSGTPPGRSSPASWPTRPNGSAPSSWSVTAGSRRVGHARGVERRESGWGWPSGYFAVMPASSSWTEIATPPPTSPPGPSTPGLRTAKRAAGSPTPLEGKALTVDSMTVQPALVKEEPDSGRRWSPGHPRRAASEHHMGVPDALEPMPLP